jgi:hypothetical protein
MKEPFYPTARADKLRPLLTVQDNGMFRELSQSWWNVAAGNHWIGWQRSLSLAGGCCCCGYYSWIVLERKGYPLIPEASFGQSQPRVSDGYFSICTF